MKAPIAIFPTKSLMIDDDFLYARLFAKNMLRNHGTSIIPNNHDSIKTILEHSDSDFLFYNNDGKISSINNISKTPHEIAEQLQGTLSVVIADFLMPDINGLEFFARIKSPFIYKILISNFIDKYPSEINRAINDGLVHA